MQNFSESEIRVMVIRAREKKHTTEQREITTCEHKTKHHARVERKGKELLDACKAANHGDILRE